MHFAAFPNPHRDMNVCQWISQKTHASSYVVYPKPKRMHAIAGVAKCRVHIRGGGSLLSPLLRLRHFPRRANFHCLPWWPPQRRRQPALPTLLVCVHALSLLLCHRGNWAGCVRTPILFGDSRCISRTAAPLFLHYFIIYLYILAGEEPGNFLCTRAGLD
jgi:hypothetical protein